MQEDIEPERKEIIKAVDRLSVIYETLLWYPIVYHIYGGFFIPRVKETVNSITDMLEIDRGIALDVACGTGLYTGNIAKRAKEVYGIDFSMGMLRKAQKYTKRENLGEMNRVLKKDGKLAVMTFVRRGFLGIKRIYKHLEEKHHIHIFDVDELQACLENTGYSDFKYSICGSMILFEANKI